MRIFAADTIYNHMRSEHGTIHDEDDPVAEVVPVVEPDWFLGVQRANLLAERRLEERRANLLAERRLEEHRANLQAERRLEEHRANRLAERRPEEHRANLLTERRVEEHWADLLARRRLAELRQAEAARRDEIAGRTEVARQLEAARLTQIEEEARRRAAYRADVERERTRAQEEQPGWGCTIM